MTTLSTTTVSKLANNLHTHLLGMGLSFRIVSAVRPNPTKFLNASQYQPVDNATVSKTSGNAASFSEKEYEKNVEVRYTQDGFYGFTESRVLRRDYDRFPDQGIFFSSFNYHDFDASTMSWVSKDRSSLRGVPPKKGDLICMQTKFNRNKGKPQAMKWFICSHQFLNMWTMIMCGPDYDSFERQYREDDPNKLRKWLMSGNRLCTNSYLKWVRTLEDNHLPYDLEEGKKRYWHLRTEKYSRSHVHVYAAIITMFSYGELPNKNNLPQNRDLKAKVAYWDLPKFFVSNFLSDWAGETDIYHELLRPLQQSFVERQNHICVGIPYVDLLTLERVDLDTTEGSKPVLLPDYVERCMKVISEVEEGLEKRVTKTILFDNENFPELPSSRPQEKFLRLTEEDFEKCGDFQEVVILLRERSSCGFFWGDDSDDEE